MGVIPAALIGVSLVARLKVVSVIQSIRDYDVMMS
jgi:hypothetical protein